MPPRGSPHWGTDARPVLALRVELCSPRLFASRACGCASVCSVAFGLGSGQQGQSIECTPLASRAPSRERAPTLRGHPGAPWVRLDLRALVIAPDSEI